MSKFRVLTLSLIALILVGARKFIAQENAGQALPQLIRSNESFGRKLLHQVHSIRPDGNVVVSPISFSLAFAAIQSGLGYGDPAKEIGNTFGWGDYAPTIAARMLLVRFEKPQLTPCRQNVSLLRECRKPEGLWVTNTFLYRLDDKRQNPISLEFEHNAKKYFGFRFVNTGKKRPSRANAQAVQKDSARLPRISQQNDALIASGTHLQTAWRGNTFSMSHPRPGTFQNTSGAPRQVQVLDSEMESYLHARTDTFEAVALPCDSAYVVFILPTPGVDLAEVERQLAEDPEKLDAALKREIGIVTMPTFHISYEADYRPVVEALGIKSVFRDIGSLVKIPASYLTEVDQKVNIDVTQDGIKANAETVAGVIYGGILAAPKPFHMELSRPFIFLIRDQVTNALVFLGAVMDPTEH